MSHLTPLIFRFARATTNQIYLEGTNSGGALMKAIASDVDLVSVQLYNFGPSPVSDLHGTVKTMQSVVDALGGDASKAVAGLIISEADFPRYNVPTARRRRCRQHSASRM